MAKEERKKKVMLEKYFSGMLVSGKVQSKKKMSQLFFFKYQSLFLKTNIFFHLTTQAFASRIILVAWT